uniref:Uncharacterized protein n=1 Tax=Psilocybe cubensis TaxID=181762 RepID=A0A8H7Y6C5_PSICU
MPSRRSRSRSRSRNRSESPERRVELPNGASPISESDYFQKNDEFRLWLKEEKDKYFDGSYYDGIAPGSIPATSNTSYKWSFASKSRADDEALRAARAEVGAATYGRESSSKYDGAGADRGNGSGLGSRPSGSGSSRVLGPAMPSASDLTLAEELTKEQRDEERAYKRKREKLEAKERMEEMVGPKPVGREGMLEKKKMRREGDRAFRERGDEGLELDESTLMGGGDSFREQLARRDMAKKRYEKKNEEKINTMREKSAAFKEKEKVGLDLQNSDPLVNS